MVSDGKPTLLHLYSFCRECGFFPGCFQDFSLFEFWAVYDVSGQWLLWVYLFGVCWTSWTCVCVSVAKFGESQLLLTTYSALHSYPPLGVLWPEPTGSAAAPQVSGRYPPRPTLVPVLSAHTGLSVNGLSRSLTLPCHIRSAVESVQWVFYFAYHMSRSKISIWFFCIPSISWLRCYFLFVSKSVVIACWRLL